MMISRTEVPVVDSYRAYGRGRKGAETPHFHSFIIAARQSLVNHNLYNMNKKTERFRRILKHFYTFAQIV